MQADMVSIDNQFNQAFDQSIKPLLSFFDIDAPDIMVSDLVLDSREVTIHKAFVAVKGHALDGRDFIPQVVSLGAKVIIAEADSAEQHGHMSMQDQSVILSFYQLSEKLSELAARFYQYPANSLSVIAVTGTNGKTSTVQLTSQLAYLLGEQAASIGTLGSDFVGEGAHQVALEASSHALVQNRIKALKTDVAVFTNLTRDHLDYHGTMQEYAQAKRLLLQQPELAYAVLNGDDPEHKNWLQHISSTTSVVLFGQHLDVANLPSHYQYCIAKNVHYSSKGVHISLHSSWGNCELRLALLGQFNVSNVLAAISAQLCLGKSLKQVAYVAQKLKPVAGRMELFTKPNSATIVVDYAHTPDALEQALLAVRQHCKGKLYVVFGCGGDRDVGKRPLMGEVAEKLADSVILTDDNVRSECAASIIQDILAGCTKPQLIQIEHDRQQAIKLAAESSQHQDMILVAGKGHENFQIIGQQTLTYNERQVVANFQKGKSV
jgi:UDP-N-acetylmuramoyl-L-alanyl-D-glutamate--2,6-diaminopimelate ligase